MGCTGLSWTVLDSTGLDWAALGFDWLGGSLIRVAQVVNVIQVVHVVQVVQMVRMICLDDMHSENISFSYYPNHQIIEES